MLGASRWTARFLVLVMLVPAFGPLAMACTAARPEAMHCARQPFSVHAKQPAMQCHHAMAESKALQTAASQGESLGESSDTSFQAADHDNCCLNHCCCGATTSEWARPASTLSVFSVLIEPSRLSQSPILQSSDLSGQVSARAPPRS